MKSNGLIDLHMHSTVSDGTDSPKEILEKAVGNGLSLFSLTDHDDLKGCREIAELFDLGFGADLGGNCPGFISGTEFSCKDEDGKYHILGYGYDLHGESINRVLKMGHDFRMNKVKNRLKHLELEYGFTFPEEEIDALLAMDNPGKPHIANLMVKYGYASSKQNAIDEYINKLHSLKEYVRPEEAIDGILRSGGIPVLAHPGLGSGGENIRGEALVSRLEKLMDFGLKGIEVFYYDMPDGMRIESLYYAERYDLYITAGSDYHGRNKTNEMGRTHLERMETWPKGLSRFLREVNRIK